MDQVISGLKLTKNETLFFLLTLSLSLAAKGMVIFNITYSVDDYANISHPLTVSTSISNGRFGWALIDYICGKLGVIPPLVNTFYSLLFVLSLIYTSVLILRIWKADGFGLLPSVIMLSFITNHPYMTELFTFRLNGIYNAISLLCAFLGLYLCTRTWKSMVCSSIMICFAISIYQITLNYILVVLLFSAILEAYRGARDPNFNGWMDVLGKVEYLPRLFAIAFGTFVYLLVNKTVQYVFAVAPSNRTQFIMLSDLTERFIQIKDILTQVFFRQEPVLPFSAKLLLLCLMVVSLAITFARFKQKSRVVTNLYGLAWVLIMLVIATVCIVGVAVPIKEWWPTPRVLSATCYWGAGITALTYLAGNRIISGGVTMLGSVIIFSFIGINNHIFTDQVRLNSRDQHKANRMISRIENDVKFNQVHRIAINGGNWGYPLPVETIQKDLNVSALFPSWGKVQVLREVSGYDFGSPTNEDQKQAEVYCNGAHPWPHPDSVKIDGELAIVCQ